MTILFEAYSAFRRVPACTTSYSPPKCTSQDYNLHCKSYGFSAPHDGSENVNDGQQLWEKLVGRNKNVRLVLSGHVPWAGARLTSKSE